MKKPIRRVRRAIRRIFHRRGKGRGRHGRRSRRLNPRGIHAFLHTLTEDDFEEILFGTRGRGKGKGKNGRQERGKVGG